MNIVVHYPKSAENIEKLQKRVATIHAQAVVGYIQKLSCPKEQKIHLVKEVGLSLRDQSSSVYLPH